MMTDVFPAAPPLSSPGFVRRVIDYWRPPRIDSVAALQHFIDRNAAYLAQKTVIDYCHARIGTNSVKLFKEDVFIEALMVCRWESYAAALSDLLAMAHLALRRRTDAPVDWGAVAAGLDDIYEGALTAHAIPAHRPQGWEEAITSHRRRTADLALAPPDRPDKLLSNTARRMYATLPVHESLRTGQDREFIHGGVRLIGMSIWEAMLRRFVASDLARQLVVSR